jgi:hypothetical protein
MVMPDNSAPDNPGSMEKPITAGLQESSEHPHTAEPPVPPRPLKSLTMIERLTAWGGRLESMVVVRLLIVAGLGVLVMIGLFLSNYSSEQARFSWCAMFPIFGAACLAHELAMDRQYEIPLRRILLRQVLHWGGPIIAVKILFMQHARGQMSTDAVALTIILLLAITCFLAGVHFDRSFYWISAFLALAALIDTEIETYLWLLVVLFLISVAIVVLSAIVLRRDARASRARGS